MIRPPVQVSDCQVVRWIFPAPGTEGVAFCGVVLIFPTPPRKSHLERDSALFRWIFPKDENSIIITPLHRSTPGGGNVVEIGTIEISEGRSALCAYCFAKKC